MMSGSCGKYGSSSSSSSDKKFHPSAPRPLTAPLLSPPTNTQHNGTKSQPYRPRFRRVLDKTIGLVERMAQTLLCPQRKSTSFLQTERCRPSWNSRPPTMFDGQISRRENRETVSLWVFRRGWCLVRVGWVAWKPQTDCPACPR